MKFHNRKTLGRAYQNPNGCGPEALRLLCEHDDCTIVSACINNGYDPERGGISPIGWIGAARQLGIKLGKVHLAKRPIPLAQVIGMSRVKQVKLVVAVDQHVLVVDKGEQLDCNLTMPHVRVDFIIPVLN